MELQLSIDRQISHLRARYDIEKQAENTLTFAFEKGRYLKLSEQIDKGSDIVKKKCLIEVNQDLHNGECMGLALISSRLLEVMVDTLAHQDQDIRRLACMAVGQVANSYQGRHKDKVEKLLELINDEVVVIREECYKGLIGLVGFWEDTYMLLQLNTMQQLVDKLIEEKEEKIQILNLTLLNQLLNSRQGVNQLLQTQGIKRLLMLTEHNNLQLVSTSMLCLASVSMDDQGKQAVQDQQGVGVVASRLYTDNTQVLTNTTKALASLAQLIEAKQNIIDNNHFSRLIQLLLQEQQEQQVVLNIIQLITSLAEHPVGRQYAITNCLSHLNNMLAEQNSFQQSFLATYLQQAIQVITWEP